MENIYAFYLDTYFLNCFLINFVIYIMACKLSKTYIYGKIKRILFATLGSVVCETALLLSTNNFLLYKILSILVIIPIFNMAIIKQKSFVSVIRMYILSLVVTLIVGGIVYALPQTSWVYIAAIAIGYLLVSYLGINRRKSKNIYQIKINIGEWVPGLYDSGNRLTNKSDGRGIHIVSRDLIEKISCEYYGEIEYETIDSGNRKIEIYKANSMVVRYDGKEHNLGEVLLGASENRLQDKMYKIILNENVFDN